MMFTNEQAQAIGLVVSGKASTALVSPKAGFEGRRIYINGGSRHHGIKGKLIHLSGFTKEECELLGALENVRYEYSARVTGFLPVTPENLKAAAEVILSATTPAYNPTSKVAAGMDLDGLFQAASK